MNRLEDALREALRREEPPVGFAERVMERVQSRAQRAPRQGAVNRWWSFRQPFGLRWAAAFASLVLLIGGGIGYRQHKAERAKAEHAKDQLMLALRITGSKLRMVQERIRWVEEAPIER